MIPVFRPSYGKEETEAVKKVLLSGWAGLGPKTEEFERKFADYIGTKYAVALNSCTAALHLALKAMGIEKREVITTPMTFVSTNHAILYNDARPVFCDIYEDTLNMNVDEIEGLITKNTRAILPVHYGGHACDMDRIMELAKKYGLKIIEDCAHACGGEYKGRKVGSIGDAGCFSFHAVKNLATGDGGMVTTNDKEVYLRLRKLRWLGISKGTWEREKEHKKYDWQYDVEEIGYKDHMNDITAAIGIVQLGKLDGLNQKRSSIVQMYNRGLANVPSIERPVEKTYAKSAWHIYAIKLEKRNELNAYLQSKGISTGVHYYPNHLFDLYKKYRRVLPAAERTWERVLTLPLFPDLKKSDARWIIKEIRTFCKKDKANSS
ncbi:MAG: pyridoxal-5'-phosphate-dependent protein [Omnitrophica bacterium RBG_13_46_9]|nr:MAG: pyridoxal-5'-phosphate-dependent protein [Omnitrophica bacterium RBG_13_46_9]